MVNMQTCTSCLDGVKKICQQNREKKKKRLNFFIACKFVTTCCDKNVICDSTIQKKRGGVI